MRVVARGAHQGLSGFLKMTQSRIVLVAGVAAAANRFYSTGNRSMPEILSVAGFMRPDAKVSLPELREALAKSLADAEAWVRWSNQSMGGTGKFLALDSGHLVVDL